MSKPIASKWGAMAGVGIGVFMATLDSSIVNISLPTLVHELNTDFATIQWVVLSYTLVLASLMLTVGRLGDMYNKKKIYLAGLVLFTTGSLLCGLSPSVGWLIGFRALQGLGATMMQALGIAIITEVFPANERGRALGLMGTVVSTGIAVGPALGGIMIGTLGWRSVFLVNIPVGLIAFFVITRAVPASVGLRKDQRFDPVGAIILLITLVAYGLGMTLGQNMQFTHPVVLGMMAVAAASLVGLLAAESKISQPMIDLSLFKNVLFSMNLLMGFLVFVVMSTNFVLPFFLELVKGYQTEQVGLLIMVNPVMMGIVAPLAGSLSDRYGSRLISIIGLVTIIIGCLFMSTLHADVTPAGFLLRLVPFGIGMGMFQSPNNSAIMGTVPRQRLGIASGLLSLSRTLGTSTGLPLAGAVFTAFVNISPAVAGTVVTDVTTAPAAALVSALDSTYQLAALVVLTSTILAIAALWIDQRRRRSAEEIASHQTATASSKE